MTNLGVLKVRANSPASAAYSEGAEGDLMGEATRSKADIKPLTAAEHVSLRKQAQEKALRYSTPPKHEAGYAGLCASFLVAFPVNLFGHLAGLEQREAAGPLTITCALVGVVVWLYFRSEHKRHNAAVQFEYEWLKADLEGQFDPPTRRHGA